MLGDGEVLEGGWYFGMVDFISKGRSFPTAQNALKRLVTIISKSLQLTKHMSFGDLFTVENRATDDLIVRQQNALLY